MNEKHCEKYRDDMIPHLEGVLDGASEAALLNHFNECASCRDELACLSALYADLDEIGQSVALKAPRVDLLDGVMTAVRKTNSPRHVVVPFEPKRPADKTYRRSAWFGLGAVAAAAMFVLWFSGYRLTRETPTAKFQQVAKAPLDFNANHGKLATKSGSELPPSQARLNDIKRMMVNEPSLSSFGDSAAKNGKPVDFEKVSVAEILALRKNYASSADAAARQEARARLAALATLSEDKARAVANSADASTSAKVGAARSLSASEAERVLLSAIQASPDDPYLRDELAKLYASQPDKQAEATAQLLEESRLDPENALNEYKLASNLLRQGDTAGATEALERAKSLQTADTYSTSSDASTAESLEASGVSSDVARAITALNSGISQYSNLIELASNLLTEGSEAESGGDTDFAKTVYESVRVLGSQISDSTSLSNERMAGLDIQSSALDSLLALATASGSTTETQTLTEQINSLATAYQEIVKILDGINTFFSGNVSDNMLQLISDFILQYGDLNLLDYLANLSNQ